MQRKTFFSSGAGSAAALMLAAGTALAPAEAAPSQLASDADVWRVRGRLVGMIAQLNGLEGDYNGKRVQAIALLTDAKNDLDAAVKARPMNEALSDAIVNVGLEETTEMMQRLTSDLGNYNGDKQKALGRLNASKLALQAALKHA